jgi:hypothetical protein
MKRNRDTKFNGQMPDASGKHDGGHPLEEVIRRRAYDLYKSRGEAPGDPVEDWCRAEREVRSEHEYGNGATGM